MYLIEAEAEAMLDNVAAAQAALKPLGEARDSSYDLTAFATKGALWDILRSSEA